MIQDDKVGIGYGPGKLLFNGPGIKDMTGLRFGRLLVIGRSKSVKYPCGTSRATWNCLCDCGNKKIICGSSIRSGMTRSCGCLTKENTSNRNALLIGPLSPSWGKKRSAQHKAAISLAHKGKKESPEVLEKLSKIRKAWTGNKNPFFGKHHSEELKRRMRNRYISPETRIKISLARRGSLNPGWAGGILNKGYGSGFNTKLKEQIYFRDFGNCQICGEPINAGRRAIHHIDYDKNNNAHSNLILLCKSCHAQTNFSRPTWMIYFYADQNIARFNMAHSEMRQ